MWLRRLSIPVVVNSVVALDNKTLGCLWLTNLAGSYCDMYEQRHFLFGWLNGHRRRMGVKRPHSSVSLWSPARVWRPAKEKAGIGSSGSNKSSSKSFLSTILLIMAEFWRSWDRRVEDGHHHHASGPTTRTTIHRLKAPYFCQIKEYHYALLFFLPVRTEVCTALWAC